MGPSRSGLLDFYRGSRDSFETRRKFQNNCRSMWQPRVELQIFCAPPSFLRLTRGRHAPEKYLKLRAYCGSSAGRLAKPLWSLVECDKGACANTSWPAAGQTPVRCHDTLSHPDPRHIISRHSKKVQESPSSAGRPARYC